MNESPRKPAANVLLVVEQNIAANLSESDEEISELQRKLEKAIARRETLRSIARASGVTIDDASVVASIGSPQLTAS